MPGERNTAWKLESFLDSLLVELDRAQDTLSVKGLSRPLTYTVKDVSLDLQIFPQFDGKKVHFVTAKPGDTGASRMAIQLGSITNEQIRRTTKDPIRKDDLSLDEVEGIDEEVKASLEKYGVHSVKDLESWERRNVDVEKLVKDKTGASEGGGAKAGYGNLASLIQQARRKKLAPRVSKVSLSQEAGATFLDIEGENLVTQSAVGDFPLAVLGRRRVEVVQAGADRVRLAVGETSLEEGPQELQIALDPYALIRMELLSEPR